MTRAIFVAFFALCIPKCWGQPYTISTIAGADRLLDGNSAINVPLRSPRSVAFDAFGNIFIADTDDNRIRQVNSAGVITTYAGTGVPGYRGDRGKATLAELSGPTGVAVDSNGNLYVADRDNYRVRRISVDGTINTVAGNGTRGFSGDNGPALSAQIRPLAVAADNNGNLFIADGSNYRIRKVDSKGIITTIAGQGSTAYYGDNGPATDALISLVTSLALDSAGNLYLADFLNGRVRKIDTAGMITTVAGSGDFGFISDGLPATSSVLLPYGVAFDSSGNLLLSDANRNVIRRVDSSTGLIFTVAGNGNAGLLGDNGSATNAALNGPAGLAVDSNNQIYFAELFNARVRKVAGSIITTLAGTGSHNGGPATSAFLNVPEGVAISGSGTVIIADTGDREVRRFSAGGIISSIGQVLGRPHGVAVDQAGNYYVTDDEPLVLKITPTGVTSIIAGNSQDGYSGDNGPATNARISTPTSVAVDTASNVYFTDFASHRIRKVAASSGTITTIAGNGKFLFSGDNGPALSAGMDPLDVAADARGNLFVADHINSRIRKIAPDGTITTVAGTGIPGYSGDGGPAISAQLSLPAGVAVDGAGNLYIADGGNSVVRRVTPGGLVTTIAGNGDFQPSTGDGGPAIAATLAPYRVAVDSSGSVYVSDSINDRIRKLTPQVVAPAKMTIVSGNNQSGTVGTKLPAPLVWKVADAGGAGVPGVVVAFTVSPPGAASLSPSPAITLNDGTVSVTVTLGGAPGPVVITASATGLGGNVSVNLTAKSSTTPSISPAGIASAGLSTPLVQALAPNAIATIFGSNFAPAGTARQVGSDDLVGGKIPTNLAGVCVVFGDQASGARAPIFAVFSGQINFQVPAVPPGPSSVTVTAGCDTAQAETSNGVPVTVQLAAPEFFYFAHNGSGHNPIAAVNALTGAFIGAPGLLAGVSFAPAKPGDILTLFATGLGPTEPTFGPGDLPGSAAQVTSPVTISLGGAVLSPSDILYVGVSQNAGLYQVNLRVPDTVSEGDQSLIISVGGVSSPAGGFITVSRQ